MFILLIILFVLQLIFNIYFLIKSIKTKDNKNWLILFSLSITSLISVTLVGSYSLTNQYLGWNTFGYLGICFFALCAYLLLLIVNSIFKIVEVRKNKKQNIIVKTLDKKIKIKAITIPLILITLLTLIVCGVDYSKYVLHQRGEINTYNKIKNKEINKMANFLNDKYKMNVQESDCIYYREQDYTRHSFGNGSTYNIPYISVFKINNERITVVDRKGFISDNRQLKDINDILINYYYQKTGIKFDYIEFNKSYGGSSTGNDNIINSVLQTKFNTLITDKSIEQFLNYVLQESDLSISFYIKDNSVNDKETLKYNIINELEYLRNYTNIKIIKVYGYERELNIKHKEIEFPSEHKDYRNSSDDDSDGYKFGCYYIDSLLTKFTFSLIMDLDRGYTSGTGELINGWKYRNLD